MNEINSLCHWLEIDLDKLAANFAAVQDKVGGDIIAVVKNDAYGFGAVQCAKTFVEAGAKMLAVTTLYEALELREAGISAPVLVFLPPLPGEAAYFAEYDLTATVDSQFTLQTLADVGQPLNCHIKLNTGMNRLGVDTEQLADLLAAFKQQDNLCLTGAYSHLATALEQDKTFALRQIAEFERQRQQIMQAGFEGVCFHLANSAGALRFPQARFDAVRLGSVLYGQLGMAKSLGVALAEPFRAKARIVAVRDLKKGETVGYGREFCAPRNMRIAVVPFGYGDGFGVQAAARPLTVKDSVQTMSRNVGKLLLGRYQRCLYYQGKPLAVLGRVAMQSLMVDIGDLPLAVGDVVEAPMRRTSASARLPRVYLQNGEVCAVRSYVSAAIRQE